MMNETVEHVVKKQKLNSTSAEDIIIEKVEAQEDVQEGSSSNTPLVEEETASTGAAVATTENVKFSLKVESGKNSVKKQVAKVLEKAGIVKYKNIKTVPKWTYCLIHFNGQQDLNAAKAIIGRGDISHRNKVWTCEVFHQKQRTGGQKPNYIQDDDRSPEERIADQTTPLWKHSYEEQLELKQKQVLKSLSKLKQELFKFFPKSPHTTLPPYDEKTQTPLQYIKSLDSSELRAKIQLAWLKKAAKEFNGSPCELLPIFPSPTVNGYRSKCEFTFGRDLDGEKTCGLLLGLFKEGVHAVLNAKDCLHVSPTAKTIANIFEEYVCNSPYDVFCRILKKGVYRIVLVRTLLSGENMVMVQINPTDLSKEQLVQEKENMKSFLLKRLSEENISLNSFYFQESADVFSGFKEGVPTELLHGTPFITEQILGQQFQISPSSFFQVNPTATEVLYSKIREITLDAAKTATEKAKDGEYVFVEKSDAVEEEVKSDSPDPAITNGNDEIAEEHAIVEEAISNEAPGVVLLDLCCGTGTIGITMAAHVKKVIGVELTADAIEDAKKNAALNGVSNVFYINAKVEDVMDEVFKKHVARGDTVVAVLDPPRAGVHNSVIKAIRGCQFLDHVIFVACALKSSMQNLIDLMRPTSNKMQGFPFVADHALIVDLFPHTEHVEVIMKFTRQQPFIEDIN